MKISKLFHWLYAFLMLLPVFALMPSMFYFAFNQKADNYTYQSVTETYEYETNEVNSVDDLVVGNVYKIEYNTIVSNNVQFANIYGDTQQHSFNIIKFETNAYTTFYGDLENNDYDYLSIYSTVNGYGTNSSNRVFWADNLTDSFRYGSFANYNNISEYHTYVIIQILIIPTSNFNNYAPYISASDYLGEKSVTITESEQSPMNIFYSSVDKLFTMPIFAWAKTSFLVTPFTYIGNLFGLQATSPVIYMLSYWLAISIVWLVFDLIMYVPLLVHRWIDKGILE